MSENFIVITLSVTNPAGGVSITIYSKSFLSFVINSFILSEFSNSDGLGGTGPEDITFKFSFLVLFKISEIEDWFIKYELSPFMFSILKSWCVLGFLKSAPINTVLYPAEANIKDKLEEQNVFPSDPTEEVIVMTLFFLSKAKYWILVLKERKDSEITDFGLSKTTKLFPLSALPITPKIGILVCLLKSDLLLIFSLKKSFREMTVTGIPIPKKRAII